MKRPAFENISEARRRNMKAIRARNTKPEMVVRRLLHAQGYRYRLHVTGLPGRPDLVFPSRKKAVEVRGCFWHHHTEHGCRNGAIPISRREWWVAKLTANVARDARNLSALTEAGWDVLVIWECEVRRPDLLTSLTGFLGPPRQGNKS